MSTKTTFKRVALVAVAALGLGVMSSVAPANAVAEQTVTSISAGTLIARPTVGTTSTLTFNWTQSAATTDTITVGAKITSAPTSSASAALGLSSATFAGATTKYGATSGASNFSTTTGTAYATVTGGTSLTSARSKLTFTPDLAGTYQILVWVGGTSYSAGYTSTVITVTTSGAPTTATLTQYGATFAKSAAATSQTGGLLKVVLKDADGKVTTPTANESIDFAQTGAADATTVGIGGTAQSTGSKKSYSSGWEGGSNYVSIDNTAAETITISVTGSGLLSGNGLLASAVFVSKTVNASTVVAAVSADVVKSILSPACA